ncbi:unnamed protein product [Nesidiocoris tenuis]|uniref:Uncharacterized protein n=1 Tax=Nesidiocoris tenuis TaxID=355587 RepID=A0A6H5G4K7_9HEMI|nr:unnamed protein product [Nesidiocoris tenuis]
MVKSAARQASDVCTLFSYLAYIYLKRCLIPLASSASRPTLGLFLELNRACQFQSKRLSISRRGYHYTKIVADARVASDGKTSRARRSWRTPGRAGAGRSDPDLRRHQRVVRETPVREGVHHSQEVGVGRGRRAAEPPAT